MTTLQAIKEVIEQIDGYQFVLDKELLTDASATNAPFPAIYVEESRTGNYALAFGTTKVSKLNVHFIDIANAGATATERELIRERLECEAVIPFIEIYNECSLFKELRSFAFSITEIGMNEQAVSIVLQFDCSLEICG